MNSNKAQVVDYPSGNRTNLAVKRTLMAADRTLMAWLRTALSMISFGFTIYKILEGFQGLDDYGLANKFDARMVGEFLVGLGTLSMVMRSVWRWQGSSECYISAILSSQISFYREDKLETHNKSITLLF